MEAFAQTTNRYTSYRNSSLATAGTAENMYLIGQGELEFGHSTSVDWTTALAGQKPYTKPVHANQLFAYAIWQQLPIVRADSGLQRFSDLGGRTFSPSLPGSGTAAMYRELIKAADLKESVRWRYGAWSEVYTAFRANQIDSVVGVRTNGRPSSGILELEATLDVRVLDIPPSVVKQARAANPGILEGLLDSKTWAVIKQATIVPQMTGILASHPNVSDEVGYTVTRSILDRAEEVRKFGSPLSGLTVELAARYLLAEAPVNAGAAQYFKENGVWRSELSIAN
jgi:TRAP transporter TAXI family solute receptor